MTDLAYHPRVITCPDCLKPFTKTDRRQRRCPDCRKLGNMCAYCRRPGHEYCPEWVLTQAPLPCQVEYKRLPVSVIAELRRQPAGYRMER